MSDELSVAEVARRLGVTTPTVRAMLEAGELSGRKIPWGTRFKWRVDGSSVTEGIGSAQARSADARRARKSRLTSVEAAVQQLLSAGQRPLSVGPAADGVARERDDLRARVVTLEDALARARTVADLQRQADAERATVVEHLMAALSAAERADQLRRTVAAELDDAASALRYPGHPGELRA
jgi:excisionase family DNA binding protein